MNMFPSRFPSQLAGSGGGSPVSLGFFQMPDGTYELLVSSEADFVLTVNGTDYTVTVADMAAMPHKLTNPVISGTGSEGQTLTAVSGLWLVDVTSGQSIVRAWLRNGTPISGATGATYVVQAADGGTTITHRETVGAETATSNSIAVAGGAKTVTFIEGVSKTTSNSQGNPHIYTATLPGTAADDILIVGISLEASQSAQGTFTLALGANSGTQLAVSATASSAVKTAFFRVVHPGGSPSLSITAANTSINRSHAAIWKVTGASTTAITSGHFARQAGASPGSMNLNTTTGDILLTISGGTGNNGATLALSGAGAENYSNIIPTNLFTTKAASEVLASGGTPRSVSSTWSNNSNVAGVSITI